MWENHIVVTRHTAGNLVQRMKVTVVIADITEQPLESVCLKANSDGAVCRHSRREMTVCFSAIYTGSQKADLFYCEASMHVLLPLPSSDPKLSTILPCDARSQLVDSALESPR
ncbi:hypothetical protein CBL_04579 [Carabus blaptoides fortunei]